MIIKHILWTCGIIMFLVLCGVMIKYESRIACGRIVETGSCIDPGIGSMIRCAVKLDNGEGASVLAPVISGQCYCFVTKTGYKGWAHRPGQCSKP